jgi:hypothetical protein
MLSRLLCLLRRHHTSVVFTEGQVRCQRCGRVLEIWKVLRPEQVAKALRDSEQFWARIEARQARPVLRRVK